MKICVSGQGQIHQDGRHGYKIAKTFKNLLLQNQKAYDFETWHEASGNEALQSLYKSVNHDPGMILT